MNTFTKERVLVVDDEPQVLVALEDLLSDDFTILKTSSPKEALEYIDSDRDIAVVLTDQRMPAMTGDKLLAHVEQASDALGIMITGFADLSAVVTAVNEGRLFAYVTKPWNSEDLKFKVHQAVDRFRLSQELAYERRLLHDLMDNTPDGIYFKDRQHGLIRVNNAYARSMGYPNGEAMLNLFDLQGAPDSQISLERQVLESGVPTTDRVREQSVGSLRRWVSETVAPVRGQGGEMVGLVGITRDVTARVETEEALRQSELRHRAQTRVLSSILESMGEGVVVADRHGRFIVCNDQAAQLLGTRLDQGHHVSSWTTEVGLYQANQETPITPESDPLRRALDSQVTATVELFVVNEKTKGSTILMTATPLRVSADASDGMSGAVAVLRDISHERELERQFIHAQKMDAVGRLAGGVAHDFNNLLSIIESYGDLLLTQFTDDDTRKDDLKEMLAAAERAARLTRQLLTFSRSGVIKSRPLQLNEVISGVEKMLQRTLGEDIKLVTDLDDSIWMVASDVSHIEQIVLNLAVNARDAMTSGGTLTIKTRSSTSDELRGRVDADAGVEHYVLLTVNDTGTGMSEEVRARIFEPFFTTKDVGKGTGIGLSTVYGIVTRCGGSIWVDSELGAGTTFYLAFPAASEPSPGLPSRRSNIPESAPGKTILLVEDDVEVRRVTGRILREEGYSVIEATNASMALELIEKQPIDLLLTDVVMPEMNGLELAQQVTQRQPNLRILFMSGYAGDRFRGVTLIDEGAYLEKPLTRRKLLEHIARLLTPTQSNGSVAS
jgi:two-component system, cell cycle sensor histidine kinase and response regulator CckA